MINSEDDVRIWVRQASAGKARWVEPALGSTPGLPDCWVVADPETGCQVHLELKAGSVKGDNLRYKMRPEQVKQINAMRDDGVKVGLLVGLKGTNTLIFARISPKILSGEFSLHDPKCEELWSVVDRRSIGQFWLGVNFIFSDSRNG